jgi:LAO/AO transport system kinase
VPPTPPPAERMPSTLPPVGPLALVDRALAGDRRALARILTAVENRNATAEIALRALHPLGGRAHLVGVTGAPGAGKSTLVAALVGAVRASGRPVAVIAVDPSSPITGGAILGDRVRMQEYAGDRDVFIRSMASRGHAGGLAAATAGAALAFDAVGFPVVFIETVGTGQAEVEVASLADTTVVVQAPGMGDEVQALKAGLLEVADIVVVSKGDRPGARRALADLSAALGPDIPGEDVRGSSARRPPLVLLVSAVNGDGVAELLTAVDDRAASRDAAPESRVRLARATAQVQGIASDRLRSFLHAASTDGAVARDLLAVAEHRLDPFAAADHALAALAASLRLPSSASDSPDSGRDPHPISGPVEDQ